MEQELPSGKEEEIAPTRGRGKWRGKEEEFAPSTRIPLSELMRVNMTLFFNVTEDALPFIIEKSGYKNLYDLWIKISDAYKTKIKLSTFRERFSEEVYHYEYGIRLEDFYNNIFPPVEVHAEAIISIKDDILKRVKEKTLNKDDFYRYVFELPIHRRAFSFREEVGITEKLDKFYKDKGYTYHYYGWVNESNPMVLPDKKEKVTIASFERNSILQSQPHYKSFLDVLSINPSPTAKQFLSAFREADRKVGLDARPASKIIFNVIGWKKTELIRVLKEAGFLEGRSIATKHLGFPTSEGKLYLHESGDVGNKWYHHSIFRRAFHTLQFVDWKALCSQQIIPINYLRYLANTDFGIPMREVRDKSYSEICDRLKEISSKKEVLKEELKTVPPALIYQPGSAIVTKQVLSGGVTPIPEYSQVIKASAPFYVGEPEKELIRQCQDPGVTKEFLAFIAGQMGVRSVLPPDLKTITKEEICKRLINYVRILQRTKQI